MRGDFSRTTHRPNRHYSRVLLQQGRVILDADWNEQTAIQLDTMRTMMSDLVGPHGGPSEALAFRVQAEEKGGKLVLFVDNGFTRQSEKFEEIVAEAPAEAFAIVNTSNEANVFEPGRLVSAVTDRDDTAESVAAAKAAEEAARAEAEEKLRREAKREAVAFAFEEQPLIGRYYVDGIMVENDLTLSETVPVELKTEIDARFGTVVFVYLEVWERHMTWIEENKPFKQRSMREIALDGPDTCSRAEVHFAIKTEVMSTGGQDGNGDRQFEVRKFSQLPLSQLLQSRIRLAAGLTAQDIGTGDPCRDTAQPRYRGPENRLYRVEIHSIGEDGRPAFKWSRENGSVVFPIDLKGGVTEFESGTLNLALGIGSDPRFGLVPGNIVELVTEAIDAAGEAGPLFEVESIDAIKRSISLTPIDSRKVKLEQWALLRRWDQPLDSKRGNGGPADMRNGAVLIDSVTDEFVLEDGIVVRFIGISVEEDKDEELKSDRKPSVDGQTLSSDGQLIRGLAPAPKAEARGKQRCRVGDYWLIPARTIPGDVEWPKIDLKKNEGFELPHGITRHYAPLAIVRVVDGSMSIVDLRRSFDPLAR